MCEIPSGKFLDRGTTNVFCNRPDGKYLKLSGSYHLSRNPSFCRYRVKEALGSTGTNEYSYVPIKL